MYNLLANLITEQKSFFVTLAAQILPPEEPVFVDESDDTLVLKLPQPLLTESSLPTGNDITDLIDKETCHFGFPDTYRKSSAIPYLLNGVHGPIPCQSDRHYEW